MRRRDFITLLGGAVATSAPRGERAAGRRNPAGAAVELLAERSRGPSKHCGVLETFQRLGWTNGRNVWIEYRWGAGDVERITASAAELVHSAPNVIVVVNNLVHQFHETNHMGRI